VLFDQFAEYSDPPAEDADSDDEPTA
jgi:hypothetical protein